MAFISRTRNLSFLAAFVLGPLIACFATHGMLSSSTAYFSPNVFSVLCPVSLIYSIAAHVALRLYPAARFHHTNLIEIPSSVIADGRTRVAIVTGANTGIGFETARTLVEKHQTTVILACRSRDKAILAAQEINASVSSSHSSSVAKAIVLDTPLDLLSPSSITNFVQAVADEHYIIDILVNNAGRNTNPEQDGDRDVCFQSNFLGHFQLTLELLKRNILSSSHHQARIVNLSSVMHHFVGGGALSSTHDDLETQTTWNKAMLAPPTDTYALSKVAMVLFSLQLNALYGDRVRAFAINPGSV
jgi:NAD(P)-dependent dehydrogenase (short-subunit alcohol dehydrogenase family)